MATDLSVLPDAGASGGLAVIGAGALGTTLARRLVQRGYSIEAVISRTAEGAQRLADATGARVASAALHDLPDTVRMVFCCVPDDAVVGVTEALYLLPRDWAGTLVAHTSGALTAAELAPLAARGAATLSLHPLQTFTRQSPPEAFEGIYVSLEGESGAVGRVRALVEALGSRPLVVDARDKVYLHLAAAVASNFFVTLTALAGEVLTRTGLDRQQGMALLRPLLEGTGRNLAHQLPEDALSGPIARGDGATIGRHLDALTHRAPHLLPVYAALSVETLRVAVRGGRLSREQAQHLLDLLHGALEPRKDAFL